MFIVRKLLKTALKTYFGKYVLNESKLNNLNIEADGKIELCDIEFNCKEINQHLKMMGLKVDQCAVKKMNIHVTWEKIINKIEFTGVIVNLGIADACCDNLSSETKDNLVLFPIKIRFLYIQWTKV